MAKIPCPISLIILVQELTRKQSSDFSGQKANKMPSLVGRLWAADTVQ